MRAMRIAVLLAGVACLLAFAASAGADPGHTVSQSTHLHGVFDDPQGFNPCTNDTVVWHVDGNLVEHVTFFPGGDEFWATFTETGTVNFSEAGVDWSGHFTEWGNENQNETNGKRDVHQQHQLHGERRVGRGRPRDGARCLERCTGPRGSERGLQTRLRQAQHPRAELRLVGGHLWAAPTPAGAASPIVLKAALSEMLGTQAEGATWHGVTPKARRNGRAA